MPLSAANKISIVSVIGLYIGIFVTLFIGMIQIRQQLKQKENADTESGSDSEEEHDPHSNPDTSEPPEHQSSSIPTTVTSQGSQDLVYNELFDYSEDPFPNLGHPRSIASTTTLPAHMGHHSSSELIELKPMETEEATKLDESDSTSRDLEFESDLNPSTLRPPLARGISAPSFLN